MKNHERRMRDIFSGVIPKEGTPAFAKMMENHEKHMRENSELNKIIKKNFEKAKNQLIVQNYNGINLNIDNELRHFLREFNNRAWQYGLRFMPMMFNIMEAFFYYNKPIIYFELIEEEDYLFSFNDFIDFYTSNGISYTVDQIYENLEENIIYNYNVGVDIDKIKIKSDEEEEFVISGISLIRRKNEVTVLMLLGQITDTETVSQILQELKFDKIPEKEKLEAAEGLKREAVKLNDNPNYWKSLLICRVDLDTQTIDARYLAKDMGDSYQIYSDEISGFLNDNGQFINDDLEGTFKENVKKIQKFESMFEMAKMSLYLPIYFNYFNDLIIHENHQTGYTNLVKSPFESKKYKNVEDKFKIRTKPLWILNRNSKFSPDIITLRDDKFKIETSGYWKKLRLLCSSAPLYPISH